MTAAEYNARLAELRSGERWWADEKVELKALRLWGPGPNMFGTIERPQRETVARHGRARAEVLLAHNQHGLWAYQGTFESPTGRSSGLPSMWGPVHDTRESARLAAIRQALVSAEHHATQTAVKGSAESAAKVAKQLRAILDRPEEPMSPKVRELPTASLSLHPQVNLVPAMSADQFKVFKEDVKARGVQKPIELIPGTKIIIDGRSRWMAATDAGLVSVPVVDAVFAEDESPVAYMIRVAYLRRQLTTGQRAALGVELKRELARAARERKKAGALKGSAAAAESRRSPATLPATVPERPAGKNRAGEAREQAAAAVGVSGRTISTAEKVQEKAPELFEQVKNGTMKLAAAARVVAGDKPKAKPAPDPTNPEWTASVTGGPVELLPCPFCGSSDVKVRIGTYRLVQCEGCLATGPRKSVGEDVAAREAWNRRAK
jgi:ParB-like chromosome segregation protein Spo0J